MQSEAVYGLLDSGAIPNVMPDKFASKNSIHMEICNVLVWNHAFRIEEFRSNISKNDGQILVNVRNVKCYVDGESIQQPKRAMSSS